MKSTADKMAEKQKECSALRFRINSLRRRRAKLLREFWELARKYEAECRGHCTANNSSTTGVV